MHETPAAIAARVRGTGHLHRSAPVQVDELLDRFVSGLSDLNRQVADDRGAADLAPDLVARLLVERGQVLVPVTAGSSDDGADVLLLARRRASADRRRSSAPCKRRQDRIGDAQPAQVDDVPGLAAVLGVGRLAQEIGQRGGHGREIGRRHRIVA